MRKQLVKNVYIKIHFLTEVQEWVFPLNCEKINKLILAYCFKRFILFKCVLSTGNTNYLLYLTLVDKCVALLSSELLKQISNGVKYFMEYLLLQKNSQAHETKKWLKIELVNWECSLVK